MKKIKVIGLNKRKWTDCSLCAGDILFTGCVPRYGRSSSQNFVLTDSLDLLEEAD